MDLTNPKAEEIAKPYVFRILEVLRETPERITSNAVFSVLVECMKSYADSVANTMAEERGKGMVTEVQLHMTMSDAYEKGSRAGYRDGQDRMRERAAVAHEANCNALLDDEGDHVLSDYQQCTCNRGSAIRSLEVEEK